MVSFPATVFHGVILFRLTVDAGDPSFQGPEEQRVRQAKLTRSIGWKSRPGKA